MKDNDTLADYPRLKNRSTVNLTGRLLGGGKNISRPHRSPSSAIKGNVKVNNECNICDNDPSITLPCKHNYCVNCLINQVKTSTIVMVGGRPSFKCYGENCKSHWNARVLGRIDKLTDIDFNKICTEIAEARTRQNAFVAECPGCLVLCQRPNVRTLRVQCPICHKKGKPDFCWECKQPWKGSDTSYCGNEYCSDILTKTKLLNAPLKKAYGIEIRSVRMCPNCRVIIEHKDCCKNITCKCGQTFCFRCLIQKECTKKDCQLAPIQTVD